MIEIIIAGRNDGFGGEDFIDRLCAASSANHEALKAASVAHRFTLVEWNPIPGRKSLSSIVTSRLPWWDACLIVSAEWHQRLSTNPHLQFMEFFAKNAAIRRSTAPVILTTSSDVFLSRTLVARLAEGEWRDRYVYRAERVDVNRRVNWREADERVFADPANQIRVNRLEGPDYGHAAGDFLLLTRDTYEELGGFNETVRFAKVHKAGQFCHRAWRRGLSFDVLGTIWHIDHEGSYANAGASLGSATAPYGPEWDYRVDYENPPGWGLTSAVPQRSGRRITTLQHPISYGPLVSIVATDGAEPEGGVPDAVEVATTVGGISPAHCINEGLARSHGQYLCILPGPLSAEVMAESLAAAKELQQAGGHVGVPSWAMVEDAGCGWLAVDDAPLLISRDLYEQIGGCDQIESDPLRAFFLTAAARSEPHRLAAWEAPTARVARCAIRPRQGLLARTVRDRERPGTVDERSAAMCEYLSSAADLRGWLAQFVERVTSRAGRRGAVCAIVGLDWATPWVIEALQAAGCGCAGVFTADGREAGTLHWGEPVRAIEALAASPATDLFITVPQPLVLERIVAAGYGHAVHVLAVDPALARAPRIPSELDRLRAAQARDMTTENLDAVLARIEPLTALEGPHWALHAYEAAILCDRQARAGDALRLFSEAASPRNPDAALRARAAFHQGRLLADSHDDARAVQVFDSVLTEQPDHSKAWEYLVTVLRRAKDAAKLEARLSPPVRDRWRQGVFAPGYAR